MNRIILSILVLGSLNIGACKKTKQSKTENYPAIFSMITAIGTWTPSSISAKQHIPSKGIVITLATGLSETMDFYISKSAAATFQYKSIPVSSPPAELDLNSNAYTIGAFTLAGKTFDNWAKASLEISSHDTINHIIKGKWIGGAVSFTDFTTSLISGGTFDIKY